MDEQQAVTESVSVTTAKRVSPVEVLDQQIADLQQKREAVKATEDFKGQFFATDGQKFEDQASIDGAFLRAAGGAMEARLRAGHFPDWHTAPTEVIADRAKAELEAGSFIDAAICALMAQAHQSLAA